MSEIVAGATAEAPHREIVRADWVDYNGHMNVAYYILIFDHATDVALERLGLGEAYRLASGCSVFVAEAHVTYEQEVREGEAVSVHTRVLGFDGKRLILFHEMLGETDNLTATNEVLCLHVNLRSRRAAAVPPEIAARLAAAASRDAEQPRPVRAGRSIGLERRRPV